MFPFETVALLVILALVTGLLIGLGMASDGRVARAYMDDER